MLEHIFQIGLKRFFEKVAVGSTPGAGVNTLPPVPGFTMAPNSGIEPMKNIIKAPKLDSSTGVKQLSKTVTPSKIPSIPKLK